MENLETSLDALVHVCVCVCVCVCVRVCGRGGGNLELFWDFKSELT